MKLLLGKNYELPLDDESVDIIISLYSLEHIFPLEKYLQEIKTFKKIEY